MKLLINTQYKENYAWHNEDYVHGVSEPYWKYKGGSAYVLENVVSPVETGDTYDMLHKYYPEVVDAISMSDNVLLIDDGLITQKGSSKDIIPLPRQNSLKIAENY